VTSPDWTTISSLATAAGTLTLAVATFASIRSASRSARAAERSLQIGLRPVLMSSRPHDDEQKVHFQDDKWILLPGGGAAAETGVDVVYFAASLRNVGRGLAVMRGWRIYTGRLHEDLHDEAAEPFRRLTRDLYVAAGDIGYWQGTFRDPQDPQYSSVRDTVERREPMTIELLYGDHEGGQRAVTRFVFIPRNDGAWFALTSRHWNLDGANPR
jgi:hypothetical protein